MDANTVLPPHFNLTGQVTIQNTPDFMGNYSFVYRGIVRGNLVAVKIIKPTGEPESMKRKVLRERFIWGSMNHPNIHPFYGYADDPGFGPFGALVSPWSAKGDASRFLKENGEQMVLAQRISLWKGVIEGVLYLHDQTPPIVHGDLKPGNILLNDSGIPKLCDFGLARIFLEQGSSGLTTTSEHTGTARYLAPELVASDTTVYPTLASDVYALGCLGLDFIYLQQPFSNHPNNLRGQIFRDLRRGLPPANQRPQQAWPSLRAWPILAGCWNSDPRSRPSAFAAARMLTRTTLTFPTIVIKRIAHFVDIQLWDYGVLLFTPRWEERCRCLRHLCLVSRAYRECATPFLYREVRLVLNNERRLSSLTSALDGSASKSPFSPQEPAGYGTCTKFIFLLIVPDAIHQADLAVGIRNLTNRLPGLRLTHIHSYPSFEPGVELSPLTTLTLDRVDLAILFDHSPTLQVLESLQRLLIEECYDSASSGRSLRGSLPAYLPNLLEISFQRGRPGQSRPFAAISTWTMPRLRSLHFGDNEYVTYSLLFDSFELLRTHGSQLQHLRLTSIHLREQDISNLLALCSSLRSLDIDSKVSLFTLSASHARLEKIRLIADRQLDVAVGALKSLKLKAERAFPKFIEAEILVHAAALGILQSQPGMVSFRTGDTFITLRGGSRTYNIFDGRTDLVGEYFRQAVDRADLVMFGQLSIPLEVPS